MREGMATSAFERAQALAHTDHQAGIDIYFTIAQEYQAADEDGIRIKEQSILELGLLLAKENKAEELCRLIKAIRQFLGQVSKTKALKLVCSLVDMFLDMEANTGREVEVCLDCIEWAKVEKRTFLQHTLEARLVALYYDTKSYSDALALGSSLLRELKKLDDKNLLMEVQLLESKTYYALGNLPKARAALPSASTIANAIYCPPKLQASLYLQAGIHAADEKDFKTAYANLYEAFERFDSVDNPNAIAALKYMLLSKIMLQIPEDVHSIISSKVALKYAVRQVDALKQIAQSCHKRSLADFQEALTEYKVELEDPIIRSHLDSLYDSMLEQNHSRIIQPYYAVEYGRLESRTLNQTSTRRHATDSSVPQDRIVGSSDSVDEAAAKTSRNYDLIQSVSEEQRKIAKPVRKRIQNNDRMNVTQNQELPHFDVLLAYEKQKLELERERVIRIEAEKHVRELRKSRSQACARVANLEQEKQLLREQLKRKQQACAEAEFTHRCKRLYEEDCNCIEDDWHNISPKRIFYPTFALRRSFLRPTTFTGKAEAAVEDAATLELSKLGQSEVEPAVGLGAPAVCPSDVDPYPSMGASGESMVAPSSPEIQYADSSLSCNKIGGKSEGCAPRRKRTHETDDDHTTSTSNQKKVKGTSHNPIMAVRKWMKKLRGGKK